MKEFYVIKNRSNQVISRPTTDFDMLWRRVSLLESKAPKQGPYLIENLTSITTESLQDKPKMRNKSTERKYYINDEEMDRDDFYDELVIAEPTDQQMIELENNPEGITLQGETFRIEQDRNKDKEETEETNEDIENPYTTLKESLEDGILNLVVFQNTNSGFYDSIDFFSEEDAQDKADELLASPGKYSHIKIVRMKKNNQKKFLSDADAQDKFFDDGTIPEEFIEDEEELGTQESEEEFTEDDFIQKEDEVIEDEKESEDDLKDEETINNEDEEEPIGVPVSQLIKDEDNMKFKDDELEG